MHCVADKALPSGHARETHVVMNGVDGAFMQTALTRLRAHRAYRPWHAPTSKQSRSSRRPACRLACQSAPTCWCWERLPPSSPHVVSMRAARRCADARSNSFHQGASMHRAIGSMQAEHCFRGQRPAALGPPLTHASHATHEQAQRRGWGMIAGQRLAMPCPRMQMRVA